MLASSDFIQKTINLIGNISPNKTSQVKGNSVDWFYGEVAENIIQRDYLNSLSV